MWCGFAISQYGEALIILAAQRGHRDMVELLLDRGADLEAKDNVSAATVRDARRDPGRHGG